MLFHHPVPGARITVLECKALRVGPIGHNDRIAAFLVRTVHVGAQYEPVIHLDWDVPIDAHAVKDFASGDINRFHSGHPGLPFAAGIQLRTRQ